MTSKDNSRVLIASESMKTTVHGSSETRSLSKHNRTAEKHLKDSTVSLSSEIPDSIALVVHSSDDQR
jgi:hypothetical protein